MKFDPDAILKLSLAGAALMAGAGIGGYYGIYLPIHTETLHAQRRAADEKAAAARAKAARADALALRKQQEAARTGYDDCVAMAGLAYRNRWNASCRTMRESDIEAYQDCLDNWFSSKTSCRRKHPVRPAMDCDLPADVAAAYSQDFDTAKAECLGNFKVSSGQSGGAGQDVSSQDAGAAGDAPDPGP